MRDGNTERRPWRERAAVAPTDRRPTIACYAATCSASKRCSEAGSVRISMIWVSVAACYTVI